MIKSLTFINLPWGLTILLSGILCGFLFYIYYYLHHKIYPLKKDLNNLERELKELDHQAKLIIQSDIESKLYREAVEDKLKKLSFLKNFINNSLNILDRDELFQQISEKVIRDMGFEKALIVLFGTLEEKVNINFSKNESDVIKHFIERNRENLLSLPLVSPELEIAKELKKNLNFEEFLLGPIVSGTHIYAFLFVSKCIIEGGMSEAEKEVFSILCMYLGQCLDNIKSFEALYQAGEELENKIKEKTFELTKTLKEIEKISKMKSDFISSVSHELRTPLTSIKGFSSLLVAEKFGKLPPQAKERLKKIDDNVNKLVDMVNTLLDISRIESRRIEVKIAPYDITKLVKDTVDFLLPQIENKNINLNIDTPSSLYVYMDKNLIERVLINLVNNAIKFTPPRGEITVRCTKSNSKVTVSVKDTGCGIPKDDLEKIFQEFYRADNPINREVRGTGLGLSLVKRIIELHKEKIWVESEVGKGTTFHFTLTEAKNV
ncbi:MAG: hypothetical protein DRP68_01890 [Candidatus Omnitrophota bacterium]|nr:MAG: hypothetical protein DRP68_01890 [Candidatus Omnitrophota bacterium]HDN86156.1 HAMP domain-containing histidine kinase [Candidatus Omnitrophota bacterium]